MPYIEQTLASLEGKLTSLSKELFQLQEEMNTALEELLDVRASMDCHHRELDLGAVMVVCHNDAQLAKAKTCHAATALQWAHLDNISALNCEVMAEEGQKWEAFAKKFSVTLRACPTEDCWALMYPLQLLTSCIPLVSPLGMPATAQLWATTDTGSIPAPLTLNAFNTPVP